MLNSLQNKENPKKELKVVFIASANSEGRAQNKENPKKELKEEINGTSQEFRIILSRIKKILKRN